MLRTTRFSACFLVVIVALAAAWPAVAEPAPITPLVSATDSYTAPQRQQIRDWAEWWARDLATGDPELVSQSRRRLAEPLRASNVRTLFREEYSRALLEEIESMLADNPDIFVAVNALQVTAMLGTERAARLMTNVADPLNEPRAQVRLWAAHGVRTIFQQGHLDEGRYPGILRDLSRAAARESNWMVLQRHFEAMRAAGTANARERQVTLLSEILDQLEANGDEPHEVIRAVHFAVLTFRNQFISDLSGTEQRSFGTLAAPVLGRVFEITSKHWEKVEDENLASSYGGAVQVSEALLGIIDDVVRGGTAAPRTSITQAWESRNRPTFQQESERWLAVLRQPPYAGSR